VLLVVGTEFALVEVGEAKVLFEGGDLLLLVNVAIPIVSMSETLTRLTGWAPITKGRVISLVKHSLLPSIYDRGYGCLICDFLTLD